MLQRLINFQANKEQFSNGGELFKACKSNSYLRKEIEILSKYYLNRNVSGCQNCYMDAFIELINLKIEKIMSKQSCDFKLRNGALLRDAKNQDISLNCSNFNITNDLALYHLKTNPGCKKLFEKLPDDVDNMVKNFKLPKEEKELSDEEKAELERKQNEQNENKKVCVSEIAELLKANVLKKDIKEKFADIEKVCHKKLTDRYLAELIKRAEEFLAQDPEKIPNSTEEDGPEGVNTSGVQE